MPCVVRLTQDSRPGWLTEALSMDPASQIKDLQRKLIDTFSSPVSELILTPPIPLPMLIFGQNAQLPAIKGIITRINSPKDRVRIVLHDSTKRALSLAYAHFLATWPMRCVQEPMKQTFQSDFIHTTNAIQWNLCCKILQVALPDGRGTLPGCRVYPPQELKEMLESISGDIKSLFFVGISSKLPAPTIWDISFLVPLNEIREYSPDGTDNNSTIQTRERYVSAESEIDILENSPPHQKQPTPLVPMSEQSQDALEIPPNNAIGTPMEPNLNRKSSTIISLIRKAQKFRPANVSQNAGGGKIRIPSEPNSRDH